MKNSPWIKDKPKVISPGPVSEAGKQISSRNATKHGCCSNETLILPHESREEFNSLEHSWFRAYEPKAEAEDSPFTPSSFTPIWFLQRSIRATADAEAKIYSAVPDVLEWTEDHHRTLARFLRYQTAPHQSGCQNTAKRSKTTAKTAPAKCTKKFASRFFQEKTQT